MVVLLEMILLWLNEGRHIRRGADVHDARERELEAEGRRRQ